ARALAPTLTALAEETERERRLPPSAVEAMREAGLFHLTVPSELNGVPVEPLLLAQVVEEGAAADCAARSCVVVSPPNATFAGFIDRTAASTIFGTRGIMAGVARPIGRAVPTAGGFTVSGRWPFASGSSHADWFAAECLRYDGGGDQPETDEAGNTVSYM